MDKLTGLLLLLFIMIQAAWLNSLEYLKLPWGIQSTIINAPSTFTVKSNSGYSQENEKYPEYYVHSQFETEECDSSNSIQEGTAITILDVDNTYRFPDFSLEKKLLYKVKIDDRYLSIITNRSDKPKDLESDLVEELNKSKCNK